MIPIEYEARIYFYSDSLLNPIAGFGQWMHTPYPHSLFGLIEVKSDHLSMEVYFKDLSSGVTDYRVEEASIRVPEEVEAGD